MAMATTTARKRSSSNSAALMESDASEKDGADDARRLPLVRFALVPGMQSIFSESESAVA
jgi:hypothetical protein